MSRTSRFGLLFFLMLGVILPACEPEKVTLDEDEEIASVSYSCFGCAADTIFAYVGAEVFPEFKARVPGADTDDIVENASFSYTSEAPSIAQAVAGKGWKALSEGVAKVSAKLESHRMVGNSQFVWQKVIKVTGVPVRVEITPDDPTMGTNQQITLNAMVYSASGGKISTVRLVFDCLTGTDIVQVKPGSSPLFETPCRHVPLDDVNQVTLQSKSVAGTSRWRVRDNGSKFSFTDEVTITVVGNAAVPASILVSSNATGSINTGSTRQYTAVVKDQGGATIPGAPIDWSVVDGSPANVATISNSGLLTCSRAGTGKVRGTVASNSAITHQVDFTCVAVPTSMLITAASSSTLHPGQEKQYLAVVLDAAGNPIDGIPVAWSLVGTSASGPISISSTGMVRCYAGGTGRIRATAPGTSATSAEADVFCQGGAPVRIVIEPGDMTVTQGQVQVYRARLIDSEGRETSHSEFYRITYAVASTQVAEVQNGNTTSGFILAKALGITDVTASFAPVGGGAPLFTATAKLRVIDGAPSTPASVTINPSLFSGSIGVSLGHTATARNAAGQVIDGVTFQWSSSAPIVASVGASSGMVSANSAGGAIITATAMLPGGQPGPIGQSAVSVGGRGSLRAVVMQQAGPLTTPAIGATVRVFQGAEERGVATVTRGSLAAGEVYVPGLTAGTYRVTISLPGTVTQTFENVVVAAPGTTSLNGGQAIVLLGI